jgi:hypothetical protein
MLLIINDTTKINNATPSLWFLNENFYIFSFLTTRGMVALEVGGAVNPIIIPYL